MLLLRPKSSACVVCSQHLSGTSPEFFSLQVLHSLLCFVPLLVTFVKFAEVCLVLPSGKDGVSVHNK